MNISIFGGGIAGLMTAITLQPQSHACRIYERGRLDRAAGMGFILVHEAVEALGQFGVPLRGDSAGVPLERYRCRDAAGRVLFEQEMPAGARGMRRRDLVAAMEKAIAPACRVVFDSRLEGFEFDARGAVRNAYLQTPSGRSQVTAELFVATDGVGSRAREALFPGWPQPQSRVLELLGFSHCREALHWAGRDFNKFHAVDGGVALGVVPVWDKTLVWFLQFDTQRFPAPAEEPNALRAFVQKLVGDWGDPLPQVLSTTDFSSVYLWRPLDCDVVPRFSRENLVLLGDAAHPLLPFTSQGVSSAIADAVTLARELAKGDVPSALAAYERQRRAECVSYIAKGRELMQQFLAPLVSETALLPIARAQHA